MGIGMLFGSAAAVFLSASLLIENTGMLRSPVYSLPTPVGTQGTKRLVQISDLHKKRFGKHQHRLIAAVKGLSPDCIAITGDLVSRDTEDFTGTERLLEALSAVAPIVMSLGNHELDLPEDLFSEFLAMLKRRGVCLLDNTSAEVSGLRFCGLTLTHSHYKNGESYRGLSDCTAEDVKAALGKVQKGTILLSHNPFFLKAYAGWGAELVLSGHVHGGVIRLPYLGGVLSPERKFFPKYAKGLYRMGNTTMLVSGGLGKLRLWNPPEICVLDFAEDGHKA